MRWTKIKNIILLLLVAVNLFLLALVGVRAWRTAQNDRQTRERMLQILENSGISFLPTELPDAIGLTPQRLTAAPIEERQAALLVGEVTAAETMGTRTIYRGTYGVLSVSSSGEAVLDYFSNCPLTEENIWNALSELGLAFRETGRTDDRGELNVEACLLWGEVPLPGETLHLICSGSVPVSLTFRALLGTAEPQSAAESLSAATALLRLLDALNQQGYICSRIDRLYPGYVLSGAGPFTLEPAWFVEIDTAPWRLAVNAYTGEVTVE